MTLSSPDGREQDEERVTQDSSGRASGWARGPRGPGALLRPLLLWVALNTVPWGLAAVQRWDAAPAYGPNLTLRAPRPPGALRVALGTARQETEVRPSHICPAIMTGACSTLENVVSSVMLCQLDVLTDESRPSALHLTLNSIPDEDLTLLNVPEEKLRRRSPAWDRQRSH